MFYVFSSKHFKRTTHSIERWQFRMYSKYVEIKRRKLINSNIVIADDALIMEIAEFGYIPKQQLQHSLMSWRNFSIFFLDVSWWKSFFFTMNNLCIKIVYFWNISWQHSSSRLIFQEKLLSFFFRWNKEIAIKNESQNFCTDMTQFMLKTNSSIHSTTNPNSMNEHYKRFEL